MSRRRGIRNQGRKVTAVLGACPFTSDHATPHFIGIEAPLVPTAPGEEEGRHVPEPPEAGAEPHGGQSPELCLRPRQEEPAPAEFLACPGEALHSDDEWKSDQWDEWRPFARGSRYEHGRRGRARGHGSGDHQPSAVIASAPQASEGLPYTRRPIRPPCQERRNDGWRPEPTTPSGPRESC